MLRVLIISFFAISPAFAQHHFIAPVVTDSIQPGQKISVDRMIRPRNPLITIMEISSTLSLPGVPALHEKSPKTHGAIGIFVDTSQIISMQDESYWDIPPMRPDTIIEVGDEEIEGEIELYFDLDTSGLRIMNFSDSDLSDTVIIDPDTIYGIQRRFFETKEAWEKREVHFVEAYPVFIYNHSDSAISLTIQDGFIPMIREARNGNGEWVPVEYWTYSRCGNSYYPESIPSGYYALTKIYRYSGDFRTEMRLKTHIEGKLYYSNVFEGTVNKAQFELPLYLKIKDRDFVNSAFLIR